MFKSFMEGLKNAAKKLCGNNQFLDQDSNSGSSYTKQECKHLDRGIRTHHVVKDSDGNMGSSSGSARVYPGNDATVSIRK
jgi:hypothetical protein